MHTLKCRKKHGLKNNKLILIIFKINFKTKWRQRKQKKVKNNQRNHIKMCLVN